jgi:hypothetical protein
MDVRGKKSKAQRHQASQEAGTYLSEGRYGCVYLPPLDCKANTTKELKKYNGKAVGKLTSISEATQSVNASIVLRGNPNADNYFILINYLSFHLTKFIFIKRYRIFFYIYLYYYLIIYNFLFFSLEDQY